MRFQLYVVSKSFKFDQYTEQDKNQEQVAIVQNGLVHKTHHSYDLLICSYDLLIFNKKTNKMHFQLSRFP